MMTTDDVMLKWLNASLRNVRRQGMINENVAGNRISVPLNVFTDAVRAMSKIDALKLIRATFEAPLSEALAIHAVLLIPGFKSSLPELNAAVNIILTRGER